MRRGFLYLVNIMDCFSRKSGLLTSNTMDACVSPPSKRRSPRHSRPEIFNTDQGSLSTSFAFTTTQKDATIRISVDGHGR